MKNLTRSARVRRLMAAWALSWACGVSFAQEVLVKGVQDYLMSATAKLESKDYPGAYSELENVSRLDPDNAAAAYLAARIEIARDNLDAGMRQIEKALKINPEFAVAYFWRGYVHELKGSNDAAIADYTRSIQLDWRSEIVYLSRALLRMEKGESPGAVEDLSRVLDLNPKNASAYLSRGGIYLDSGKTSAALADFSKVVSLDPKNVLAYQARAGCWAHIGNLAGAIADYSRAIELNSKGPASYEARASLYVRSGAYEAALADYARFIEFAKEDTAYARFFHFLLCRRLARAEPADFSETVRVWPEGWQKTVGLFLVNEVDEAALLTRAAVGDDKAVRGQRCEAFYYAGMKRLLKGDVAGAREMFQKCVGMGATTFTEHDFAKAELARMDAAAK
jgi:tetratricopeptide (TPR) repeat protein